jgi:NAD(P)-dependent dehydrogenase (short-subunit alcohol dehydrogenase family)
VKLENKVALVTGAASGIGLGIAERFAREGATVFLADRNTELGEKETKCLQKDGLRAQFIQADVSKPDEITAMVKAASAVNGKLDIVVNNAATFLPRHIEDIAIAEWDLLMAVNLRAPFLVAQAALPGLKKAKGCVLNIASTAGIRVFTPNLPYSAAKAGLITMTESMAQELHPHRIRVNCIAPGAVETPALVTDIEVRGHRPDTVEKMRERGVLVSPAQVAATALHLCSEEGSAINGATLIVDSGALLV